MEMMLTTTSAKMTGLNLGANSSNSSPKARSSTSSEEMLTTPKFAPESSGGMFSPRGFPTLPSNKAKSPIPMSKSHKINEDVLTTPVLTTPKTSDLWPPSAKDTLPLTSFSPENLSVSSPTPMDIGPREPPKDLPMDSDIGLRSPCDGLLAKRRKFKQATSNNSVNSDSNSCDTPTSQNSPRDLTIRNNNGNNNASTEAAVSKVQVKLEFEETKEGIKAKKDLSIRNSAPSSPHDFKQPRLSSTASASTTSLTSSGAPKPENLRIPGHKEGLEVPSHYTPSPLTVPSPNWTVVDKYFRCDISGDMLKTPKVLDASIFDFLGPPPITPRSKMGSFLDRSPGHESDRYSGRDQRLSPRLSPRFPIPEAPTDLSSKSGATKSGGASPPQSSDPPPYPSEAEDLSTKTHVKTSTPPDPPYTSTSSQSIPFSAPHPSLQLKQEFQEDKSRSRMTSADVIKTEVNDDYDQQSSHLPSQSTQHVAAASYSHLYLHPQFHSLYQRSGGGSMSYHPSQHPSLDIRNRLQPAMDMSAAGYDYGSNMWNMRPNYDHPVSRPASAHPGMWTTPERDEDASMSPTPSNYLPQHGGMAHKNEGPVKKKSAGRGAAPKINGETRKRKSAGGRGKPKEVDEGGAKRVYQCQHCQRTYDWNYNLNRHLKYECGKENAFQCAKCSRKFPHKQNCVYHLKRKHKIICDTIDQYMEAGLVLFRGSAGPSGQQTAIPAVKTEIDN